ncbi:MAG: DUF6858 family protein [Arcobacteraceae bacterium]
MEKTIFMEKYPVYTLELDKKEIALQSVDAIIEYFEKKIESHPIAKLIAIFNHSEHTKEINGEIAPEILEVKNIIFCFGTAIPNTKVAAVRPRSIAVCELEDKFIVEFMEVPNEQLHQLIESWVKELV